MSSKQTYTGTVTVSGRGVGYFTVEGFDDDIEIQTPLLKTALNNDEVEIKMLPEQEGLRRQGEVVSTHKTCKNSFCRNLSNQSKRFLFL